MRKIGIFFCLFSSLFIAIKSYGQHSVIKDSRNEFIGSYLDYSGSEIKINPDSTFKYEWHFDMEYSWSKGIWKIIDDTIYLKVVSIFDTIEYKNVTTNLILDSLFLSNNEKPNRMFDSFFTYTNGKKEFVSGEYLHSQNSYPIPSKLYYRKHKLFGINKYGKIMRKKQQGFWTNKKHRPWYIKKNDA